MIERSGVNVSGCHIRDIGCTAVSIAHIGDNRTLTPGAVEVSDNNIHDFARVYRTVQPGVRWKWTVGARILRNEIWHAAHVGIIGSWGQDNVFDGNFLHDLGRGSSDAGAFYAGRHWKPAAMWSRTAASPASTRLRRSRRPATPCVESIWSERPHIISSGCLPSR